MVDRDMPEYKVLSERFPTARKQHTCWRCRKPIKKGSRYYRIAYLEDGVFMYSVEHLNNDYLGGCQEDEK